MVDQRWRAILCGGRALGDIYAKQEILCGISFGVVGHLSCGWCQIVSAVRVDAGWWKEVSPGESSVVEST